VANTWTGTTWFIEGDIADCFGSFDHSVLLQTLGERINDNRFLRLMNNMLTAGYLEDWNWDATLSGVPQGGIVSPVLSNIYLHKLDSFVETVLIPEYTRGRLRARNPEYRVVENAIVRARRQGDRAEVRSLYRRLHSLPSQDPLDSDYRRLRYCRYADDTLLGFAGPKAEAEQIKHRLTTFLREDLKLELSPDKTLITHARSQRAKYLGYEISVARSDRRTRRPSGTDRRNRRSVNGTVVLHVPAAAVKAKSAGYLSRGKPACRNPMINEADYNIVARFGAEYRGIVQYYLLAGDVFRLHRLRWVMETSRLKTLARKHRSSISKMAARYKAKVQTPHGPRTRFQVSVEARGQNTTGRMVRRHSTQAAKRRGPHRPPAHRTRLSEQAAGHQTAQGQMRALPAIGQHPGSPRPRARRAQPVRTPAAGLGAGHGETSPQIPGDLRRLP
jgi:Reverse transcriptase (RNA-dependent DNA polymerase)/Type II intron maturase